jgi:hypothetical protein
MKQCTEISKFSKFDYDANCITRCRWPFFLLVTRLFTFSVAFGPYWLLFLIYYRQKWRFIESKHLIRVVSLRLLLQETLCRRLLWSCPLGNFYVNLSEMGGLLNNRSRSEVALSSDGIQRPNKRRKTWPERVVAFWHYKRRLFATCLVLSSNGQLEFCYDL